MLPRSLELNLSLILSPIIPLEHDDDDDDDGWLLYQVPLLSKIVW